MDLPGNLFKKCVNLQSVSGCFRSFGIPFNPTPNGFINCHKLANVSAMFGHVTSALSCLPKNFFNTGFIDTSVDIIGADISEQEIEIPENATKG
jgi:hypothetical protein